MTPRRRMYGAGPDLQRPDFGPVVHTCWTGSDDEMDEMYGVSGPLIDPKRCDCWDAASMEFDPAGPCGLPGCRQAEGKAS